MSQSEQMMQVMAMTGVTSEALIMTSIIGTIEGIVYIAAGILGEELQQTGKSQNQCDFRSCYDHLGARSGSSFCGTGIL